MVWTPIPQKLLDAEPDLFCPACRSADMVDDHRDPNGWWCDRCGVRFRFADPMPDSCPTCGLDFRAAGWPNAHMVPDRSRVCSMVWSLTTTLVVA